jgi:hypothetical protein
VSSLNPFSCKIQIFKVKVSSFFLRNFENLQRFFTGEPWPFGHEHGVRRGFSEVNFYLRRCPQGVASVLCKKTPIFGSRRSKLDHLTIHWLQELFDAILPNGVWIHDLHLWGYVTMPEAIHICDVCAAVSAFLMRGLTSSSFSTWGAGWAPTMTMRIYDAVVVKMEIAVVPSFPALLWLERMWRYRQAGRSRSVARWNDALALIMRFRSWQ